MKLFGVPISILLVPFAFLTIKLITISDYGMSWDEPEHFYRGSAYFNYFATGSETYDNLNEKTTYYQSDDLDVKYWFINDDGHPPINGILAAGSNYIFYQKLGLFGDIEAYHLFNIFTSFLAILVVSIFSYQVLGVVGSLFSTITFSSYPLFFSESTFNIKDPAETAFFVTTVWFFWMSTKKFNSLLLLISSVFFGLAFGTKFNALFLPVIIMFWLLIRWLPILRKGFNYSYKKFRNIPLKYLISFSMMPVVVGIIFFGSWPFMWHDTINHFMKIFGFYSSKGSGSILQPDYIYAGINLFPAYWILITTFPYVLLLTAIGLIRVINDKTNEKTLILWGIWFVFTVARVSVPNTSIYGGIRQIMEFMPAMSMLAGVGGLFIFNNLNSKIRNKSYLLLILLSPFILLMYSLYKIHPHQNVYFNSLIGGLSGAVEKNIQYSGNSFGNAYKDAFDWLNENAKQDSKVALVQSTALNAPTIMLRTDIKRWNQFWSGINREGEYLVEVVYVGQSRAYPYAWNYIENFLEPVYETKVDGVSLVKVWKNDLEHTKPEMRKFEKETDIQVTLDYELSTIEANLNEVKELNKLTINFKEQDDCNEILGRISTSLDGELWSDEMEPVPSNQISEELSIKDGTMVYYFAARKAKFIRYISAHPDSCIFRNTDVSVFILE